MFGENFAVGFYALFQGSKRGPRRLWLFEYRMEIGLGGGAKERTELVQYLRFTSTILRDLLRRHGGRGGRKHVRFYSRRLATPTRDSKATAAAAATAMSHSKASSENKLVL